MAVTNTVIEGKLINDLDSLSTASDNDYMILGGNDAKKIKVKNLKTALGIDDLNSNKLGFSFIVLSDSSYPFSSTEQTLNFAAIKNCKVLFVKVGLVTSGGEIGLSNGYTEDTVILCNYTGRSTYTEGIRIYTSPNWNFLGAITVDFTTGSLKIRCAGVIGWTAEQFTVKRVYGLI